MGKPKPIPLAPTHRRDWSRWGRWCTGGLRWKSCPDRHARVPTEPAGRHRPESIPIAQHRRNLRPTAYQPRTIPRQTAPANVGGRHAPANVGSWYAPANAGNPVGRAAPIASGANRTPLGGHPAVGRSPVSAYPISLPRPRTALTPGQSWRANGGRW